ncbi:hypothetical protein MKW92_052728 [Papaver armeniacum]|nr:hypothetical protein MKW92_052728 [Papaver armeniacum]
MAELSSLIHQLRERSMLLHHHQYLLLHKQQIMELTMIIQRIDFFLIIFSQIYYPDPLISFLIYIAVLKLLSHTSRNFPGVYFHREASVVIPFFAEPEFRSCHGVIFETVGSLLSLLGSGDRGSYRQFFLDAMLLVLYVASIFADSSTMTESPVVSLKCFHKLFGGIYSSPSPFGDLPACFRPTDGLGILINIISKCLTEGTLYMEGLTNASFVSAACPLLCYGDVALHIKEHPTFRYFLLVLFSVLSILGHNEKEHPTFRYFLLLFNDVVELRAGDLVNAFAESLKNTDSLELKVAVFSAYVRISKTFSVHIWKPETLVNMMYSPKLCLPMMDCLRIAIGILGPDFVGYVNAENIDIDISPGSDKTNQSSKVGDKRLVQNSDILQNKRQKVEEETLMSNINARVGLDCTMKHEQDKEHADPMRESLLSFVGFVKPSGIREFMLTPEFAVTAHAAKRSSSIPFDLATCLEAVHSILLRSLSQENILFRTMDVNADRGVVLMLPWTHLLTMTEADPIWKTKCISVQVFSKIGKKCSNVNRSVPFTLGCLTCLYGSVYANSAMTSKLFLIDDINKKDRTTDILSRGFWCPKCDRRDVRQFEQYPKVILLPDGQSMEDCADHNFNSSVSLFFILLCDDSSEEAQAACVGIIPRILMHGSQDILLKTRSQWIKCLVFVLHNKKRSAREAFRGQIGYFLEIPSLTCLFGDVETSKKTKEQKFLDKLKHALAAVKDLEVFETLLEVISDIMNVVDIHVRLFFYSLIRWVDQLDNPHMVIMLLKGGIDVLLSKVNYIKHQLYDYLCARVVNCPAMIREFAEAVVGAQMEDFFKQMVPVVLPKLLLSALQFYHIQTGSSNQETFGAALPALPMNLCAFKATETRMRPLIGKFRIPISSHFHQLTRVPAMIQEVARVLTGSDDLSGFLRNHFFGLLNRIDRKTLHAEDLSLQKQALKLIEMLNELNGSHLSTRVPKIMVLLMHAVDKETLQSEGLSLLHFFIKQLVKVSPSSITSFHLNKVVVILEEFVVENKVLLKQHIRELPLLPSIPKLAEVKKDELRDVVDGLNNESLNVRYMVACELRCTEQSRTTVGQRLKFVCADCLGALGAVDPATMMTLYLIVLQGLLELLAIPLSKMAIQELLKIAGCQASLDDEQEGKRLWGCFLNYVKEIIAPCLISRFQLPNVADSTTVGPLYQSSISFRRWIFFLRHDMQTAMYLLPYLVLNAVCHSTAEARLGITEEILPVLNAAAAENSEPTQSSKSTGQHKDPPSEVHNELLIQCNNVSELLAAIPKVTLAKASFGCKAYARALLYYESHVLEKSGSFNPADRRSGIFEDEDVSMRYTVAWMSLTVYPAAVPTVMLCFDMDVAKILQAMLKKYRFSVAEKIALSEQALLAPLAAAAGMDSYIRAYPFVVKLHMLSELEDFHRLLVSDPFLEKSFHLNDRRSKKVLQD